MSYADQAALLQDQDYVLRGYACVRTQALVFVNDARPEFTIVANAVLTDPTAGIAYKVVAMSTAQPAMSHDSTDGDLDAAVQYVWPLVGSALLDQAAPSA